MGHTLAELFADRELYFETFLKIENKQREEVPFALNKAQKSYRAGMTSRDIVLKARQLGFTSVIMADYLVDCITIPGTVSVVVSHEEFITQRLLKKARLFYESIPVKYKPRLGHGSSYEMTWPSMNSTFYIGTAGSRIFGRGDTIHNFLGSEISRWPDPARIMTAVSQSVPMKGGRIVLESTPNGEGNYFHLGCMQAMKGKSVYKLHFFPWWLCDEYSLPPDSEIALPQDRHTPLVYTDEEQDLANRHGLTEDQIRWRRMKVVDLQFGSEEGMPTSFQEEFPEDQETCFLTTGESRLYPYQVLDKLLLKCGPPIRVTPFGLDIWVEYNDKRYYFIGADPTEGVTDPSGVIVWDITNPEEPKHCATYHEVSEPTKLAQKLMEIGEEYGWPTLAVERNGPGLAVLVLLRDAYKGVIYTQHDPATGSQGGRPGWHTSNPSKNVMAVEFGRKLMTAEIRDRRIIMEARGMRRDGKIIFSFGHDDLFMAAAIGLAARETASVGEAGLVGMQGWRW